MFSLGPLRRIGCNHDQQAHNQWDREQDYLEMVLICTTQCAGREIVGYKSSYDQQAHNQWDRVVEADRTEQLRLLCDIICNPLCNPSINRKWVQWNDA